MTIPGVGPVTAVAFVSTIDIPARFRNSRAVGAALGLTPVLHQSGESKRVGRISQCGDTAMRTLLYEAAQVLLTRVRKWSWLKAWSVTGLPGTAGSPFGNRDLDPTGPQRPAPHQIPHAQRAKPLPAAYGRATPSLRLQAATNMVVGTGQGGCRSLLGKGKA